MNDAADTSLQTTTVNARRAYQPPRLSILGDVDSLTETGSQVGMEDGSQNGSCSPIIAPVNTTFNMC